MRPNITQMFIDWFYRSMVSKTRNMTTRAAADAAFRAGFEKGRRFGKAEAVIANDK